MMANRRQPDRPASARGDGGAPQAAAARRCARLVLGFLVLLFYILTIVKMGPALFTTRDL